MRDWDVDMREGEFTQCVRRFTVPPSASLNPNKAFRNTVVATTFGAERDVRLPPPPPPLPLVSITISNADEGRGGN